ncbi:MAG: pyrrolysine--tRNA(Pyl) ligase large subunit [Deltaproteobacteria bacterium]|jgi:phenylalanyl-tRNA synthetase alpha chain|nr:pyrrolysine--tRNA(Pyl) ligase large subunit [Deltaproteobacteria bacterium]
MEPYTLEQLSRLRDLGVSEQESLKEFPDKNARDKSFSLLQKRLVEKARERVEEMTLKGGQTRVSLLSQSLATLLASLGFIEVFSPIIMSRVRLERMGLENDPIFSSQVYWLDSKRCLRPMLAPHLYEFMLDLIKLKPNGFGLFELGPCFRKESRGHNHASEFTMLNLVQVGLPLEERLNRLNQLSALIMERAGLKNWRLESVESAIYGQSLDIVSQQGLELASCSMGPHPLDAQWGFSGSWLGLGLGLERLAMALEGLDRLTPVGRSLGRLLGVPLRL